MSYVVAPALVKTVLALTPLEKIMQMGNGDLPDFSAFLQDWIRVLTTGSGGQYERMLQDALSMIQDEKSALEVAKQNILYCWRSS